MTEDDTFRQLSERLARLTKEQHEAAGALAELRKQNKAKFGTSDLGEMRRKQEVLRKKRVRLEAERDAEYARLKKKWPQLFEDER